MTYVLLCAVFLAISIGVAAASRWRAGGAASRRRVRPAALILAGAVLLVLTAVFDNVMIAAGLFAYADDRVSGLAIGRAPIEDFAYPLAAVILLPALWMLLERRHDP
ncbi:lycopene cyclase domain-containing protein [Microbacterium sp. NPDC096154]|uniref:lycopene cyclase domain-containing protein n=1 Tax=Microbacterium sp. NPDC096154 TaxID=3155549 RepID=UPI00331A8A15